MTDQPTPYRYIDEDDFCLSARLLPDLNTGGVTETLSITIEGSDEPQSVHVPAADVPAVAAGIVRAAGQPPAAAGVAPAADQTELRDRIAEALLTTPRADYEAATDHRKHRYDARCALCAYEVDTLADAVLAVLPEQEAVYARVERLALAFEVSGNEFIADQIRAAVNGPSTGAQQQPAPVAPQPAADSEEETPPAAERVRHSGPDTEFCVLCISGEHDRIGDEPAP